MYIMYIIYIYHMHLFSAKFRGAKHINMNWWMSLGHSWGDQQQKTGTSLGEEWIQHISCGYLYNVAIDNHNLLLENYHIYSYIIIYRPSMGHFP